MFGIAAYGPYLPAYRLPREIIAQVHGGQAAAGEKAVANYDEDALTMGVNASLECLDNYARLWDRALTVEELKGLFFASTTPPYREKAAASVLGSVLEVGRAALVADLTGSLRGGLTALAASQRLLAGADGSAKALVVASDLRLAEPGSAEEQALGDGACALLLGRENLLAALEAHVVVNANFPHFWRRDDERYVRSGDSRFVEDHGYLKLMDEAIRALLAEAGLAAGEVQRLVAYAPNPRLAQRLARRLGFDPERQLTDTLYRSVGDTGSAQVFLGLVAALEQARPGDKIVAAAYGDGAEAALFTVTENIARVHRARGLAAYLARRRLLVRYGRYLHFREVLGEGSRDPFSSLALLWREEKAALRLYGVRCRGCGAIHFPPRRVCDKCGKKEEMEDFRLGRCGRIYTFTNDYVYPNPDPPETLVAVDLEGGGRFYGQMTDVNPEDVRIGLAVELSFRKLHDGQGLPNYFWKAVPALGRGE